MNAGNAHSAMNGNKRRIFAQHRLALAALLLTGCLTSMDCLAYEGAAPALSNVKEMLVQNVRTGGTSAAKGCGVNQEALLAVLIKDLKNYNLPAFSLIEAKPSQMDMARIELLPEVITSNTQGVECTSWVALTAQSLATVRIPPVETPRNIVVTYWRGGILVSSAETSHGQVVADNFDKLARQLSLQFNRDQPPPMPPLGDEKTSLPIPPIPPK